MVVTHDLEIARRCDEVLDIAHSGAEGALASPLFRSYVVLPPGTPPGGGVALRADLALRPTICGGAIL